MLTWWHINILFMITSSACNYEGRFSGADTPPHWPCFAVYQIHSKESEQLHIPEALGVAAWWPLSQVAASCSWWTSSVHLYKELSFCRPLHSDLRAAHIRLHQVLSPHLVCSSTVSELWIQSMNEPQANSLIPSSQSCTGGRPLVSQESGRAWGKIWLGTWEEVWVPEKNNRGVTDYRHIHSLYKNWNVLTECVLRKRVCRAVTVHYCFNCSQ